VSFSKIRGAVRILEVAIRLHFEERDILAVHCLAAACHQVVHDLAQKRGLSTHLRHKQFSPGGIGPGDWKRFLRYPENFLKHADRDPMSSSEEMPELVELLIYDACNTLVELGESSFVSDVYRAWFEFKGTPSARSSARPEVRERLLADRQIWISILDGGPVALERILH